MEDLESNWRPKRYGVTRCDLMGSGPSSHNSQLHLDAQISQAPGRRDSYHDLLQQKLRQFQIIYWMLIVSFFSSKSITFPKY